MKCLQSVINAIQDLEKQIAKVVFSEFGSVEEMRTSKEEKGACAMDQDSVVLGCKHCWAKNRVPKNRIGDKAVCGRCHRPLSLEGLYPEQPVSISDQTFSREVLNFPGSVIVFYWAPWCGYCQKMMPSFDQVASQYSRKLKFTKLVLDQNPVTGSQYGIKSVPTLLFFKGGKQVNRVVGALAKEELTRQLQTLL